MEIDVDDLLQYPEDDLFPQDNYENGHGEGERGTRPRGRSSPPSKRRSFPTNELANKIAHLDEAALDPSLDWYLRIDLSNGKSDLETRERERKMNEVVHRIRLARSSAARSDGRGFHVGEDQNSSRNPCQIHNYPPSHTSQWMPVTTPVDKTRFYVTLKPADQWSEKRTSERRNKEQLLDEDFEKLLAKAQQLNDAKMNNREEPLTTYAPPDTCTVYFTEPMDSERVTANPTVSSGKTSESALWVDKYKPSGYIDLLSDDGVNRTLLTWLKLWDECVFGRKASARGTNIKRYTGPAVFKERLFSKGGFRGGKGNTHAVDADCLPTTLDNHKRPVHKIALLSGPPGVGKTTLAHIVGRHAGYHVQEMNASDDRTLDAFRKQLEGATQMQATLGGDRKPHCLVIDEIDGAPSASISYLVSLVNFEESRSGDQSLSKSAPAKKRNGGFVLRRPIICICNDIYAPALRELRKVALVLHVPPIELNRLTDRLSQISHRESVKAEPGCFELMCTKSGFDVRSCVNSLQLLTFADDAGKERKSDKRLTLHQVTAADVGGKDVRRSLFSAWQEIFQLTRTQKRTSQNETPSCSTSARVKNVLTACQQCGEEDRLQAGIFENYLLVEFRDPRLESVIRGLEWLVFVDQLDRTIGESQLWELKRYSVYLAAVFHLLFATRQFTKLVYPQMLQEAYFKTTRSLATLQSLMGDVKCNIRAFITCTVLIMDALPMIIEIIQPDLRPVNVQLYREQEKLLLQSVVNVMRDYNLTYRQQRSIHGQYEFVLEPPVDEIVSTSNSIEKSERRPVPLPQKSRLSDTVKQAIAHEIELAKVRTKEPKAADVGGKPEVGGQKPPLSLSDQGGSKENQSSLKNRLFGANRYGADIGNREPAASSEPQPVGERRVWFRYHEGCNDAIRRFLRVSDLL